MDETSWRSERHHGSESAVEAARFLPLEVRAPTPDARCVEASLSSLADPVTPTNRFFIRSHFAVPHIDRDTWRLAVHGQVDRPVALTYAEFERLPRHELIVTMECAGNSRSTVRPKPEGVLWGHGALGTGRWRGVRLRDVLERVGVRARAVEVVLGGADRGTEPGQEDEIPYAMSVDLSKAMHEDTLLADEMNGEPLARSHGFPVRAVVPGFYGMASVKWLTEIELVDRPFDGYFRTRAYAYIREGQRTHEPTVPATTIRVKSLITWPREGQAVPAGDHVLRGLAWSGEGAITRVEISVTPLHAGGEVWKVARHDPPSSRYAWSHWELPLHLSEAGFYILRVRAIDERGNAQPVQAEWNFRGLGNNSIHCVPIEVLPVRSREDRP